MTPLPSPASPWARWVRALDQREPATALALTRILLGITLTAHLGGIAARGDAPLLWMAPADGGYRGFPPTGSWLVNAVGGPGPAVVGGLLGAGVLAGALLTAGIGARAAAFVGLQAFLALAWINPDTGGSYDYLMTNALWLMVLADSGRTLSVSARMRTGAWTDPTPVAAWPRWLVVGQLVTMYTSTGLQKLSGHWLPGGGLTALYYIVQQPTWARRPDNLWAADVLPLTQLATLGTWLFEVGAPLFLLAAWYRRTADRPGRLRAWSNRVDLRAWLAGLGVAMHLSFELLLEVGPFSAISLAMYPCLWGPAAWDRARARLRGRGRASPPASPAPPAG